MGNVSLQYEPNYSHRAKEGYGDRSGITESKGSPVTQRHEVDHKASADSLYYEVISCAPE
jgi:hypothetical protein